MAKIAKIINGQIEMSEATLTLSDCQVIVGGETQFVALAKGAGLLVRKDGDLDENLTEWNIRTHTDTGWPRDVPVHGNVVFLDAAEVEALIGKQ
jgi:hypothetical protein